MYNTGGMPYANKRTDFQLESGADLELGDRRKLVSSQGCCCCRCCWISGLDVIETHLRKEGKKKRKQMGINNRLDFLRALLLFWKWAQNIVCAKSDEKLGTNLVEGWHTFS